MKPISLLFFWRDFLSGNQIQKFEVFVWNFILIYELLESTK